ncbi:ParB/RepB/Spo0J family partition protein [Ilumatobacter nonamiensis]|uniref:ParB/RepB/Spo0J family partition protein n=1 Tax=Ilumatobacter nonamiensis TaxID=467093 RepID=UPI0005908A58|nr:ParB/RepB/Spo0J family partition protein [Ilumatobacter nonamiensis]
MPRPSGLGKGLSSLIPMEGGVGGEAGELIEISTAAVSPNPNQPRQHFDEESLVELAASIAEMGVLQPILVRPVGDDRYELIAGERRWRATQRAGLATIPAIVRSTSDLSSVEQALVENLHRQDLSALEEAAAFQQLLEDFELTHDDLAGRVGKSRSAITNSIRLLALPPSVQSFLADGQLSAGHARALLGTPDRTRQEELAAQAVADGWTVRMVEQAVRGPAEPDSGGGVDESTADSPSGTIDGAGLTPATKLRPPGLLELEELLAEYLETRVGVQLGAKRGKVTIDFADLEDLERIYRQMTS